MTFNWEIKTQKTIEMKEKLDYMASELKRQFSGKMVKAVPKAKAALEAQIGVFSEIVEPDIVKMKLIFPGVPGYSFMLKRELKKVIKNVDENAEIKEIKGEGRSIIDKIRRKNKNTEESKTSSVDSDNQ